MGASFCDRRSRVSQFVDGPLSFLMTYLISDWIKVSIDCALLATSLLQLLSDKSEQRRAVKYGTAVTSMIGGLAHLSSPRIGLGIPWELIAVAFRAHSIGIGMIGIYICYLLNMVYHTSVHQERLPIRTTRIYMGICVGFTGLMLLATIMVVTMNRTWPGAIGTFAIAAMCFFLGAVVVHHLLYLRRTIQAKVIKMMDEVAESKTVQEGVDTYAESKTPSQKDSKSISGAPKFGAGPSYSPKSQKRVISSSVHARLGNMNRLNRKILNSLWSASIVLLFGGIAASFFTVELMQSGTSYDDYLQEAYQGKTPASEVIEYATFPFLMFYLYYAWIPMNKVFSAIADAIPCCRARSV